jgi:PAS domain-containing protein
MAKIVMIVPTEEMYAQAKAIAAHLNVELDVYYESSQTVLDRLARAQREGALVAIARGNQANLILKSMDISLIEIRLSGQSLAKLIVEAKGMAKKDHPCIGFLGFPNMFTETKDFGQLLDVTIRNYFVEDSDKIEEAVENAYKDGVDVLIGGEIALSHAMELGMSSLFLRSGEDDIEAALRSAKRVLYAIEMEKKNTAEVSTLLNYSFDGIFRLNREGLITVANYMAERIFHRRADELVGVHVSRMFDIQDSEAILSVLREESKKYAMVLHNGNISLVANLATISVDGESVGGILSFQEFHTIDALEEGIRRDRTMKGYNAQNRFENLTFESQTMKNAQRQAEQYAKDWSTTPKKTGTPSNATSLTSPSNPFFMKMNMNRFFQSSTFNTW